MEDVSELPEWLRSRARVVCQKTDPTTPLRFELVFGNFDLRDFALRCLLAWLQAPNALLAQAAGAAKVPLLARGDFRNAQLGDEGLEKLLECLLQLPVRLERLYLSRNGITSRCAQVLRELLAQGGLVDLSENLLDDAGAFTALSGAPHGSIVFLQENMVKNPPALLERLRRSGHKLKLDEDGARDCLCLPYICFQKAVESELAMKPQLELPKTSPTPPKSAPTPAAMPERPELLLDALAGSNDVASALRSLNKLLPASKLARTEPKVSKPLDDARHFFQFKAPAAGPPMPETFAPLPAKALIDLMPPPAVNGEMSEAEAPWKSQRRRARRSATQGGET